MHKKLFIIPLLIVATIIAVYGVYSTYFKKPATQTNTENTTTQNNQQENSQLPDIEINGGNNGGLLICSDKCGDGICQEGNNNCSEGGLNCICPETKLECPADCK